MTLMLFASLGISAQKMAAYLMVYHKDQDHDLHMAYSTDVLPTSVLWRRRISSLTTLSVILMRRNAA